jgi:hypothetical protein
MIREAMPTFLDKDLVISLIQGLRNLGIDKHNLPYQPVNQ